MKINLFISLIFLGFAFSSIAQKTSALIGTWKLVSGSFATGDSTFPDDMSKMESMKIVTPTHFAVFSKSTTTGDIGHAGAGTIKIDSDTYIETITYATGTGNKYPMVAKFKYELSGDQWHIKG